MKYIKNLALSSAVIALLSACGGGGGGDSSSTTPATTANTISFSGVAVDGYIKDATACLDLNINGSCDAGEPTTRTANDGTFSFTNIEVVKDELFAIIVTGGIDTATGKAFTGELKNITDSSKINSSAKLSVTPLTDLVASAFLASSTKTLTTLSSAKSDVATSLGLTTDKVDADPMKDKELFAKTQEVQQLKELILTSALKATNTTAGSTQAKTLEKNIVLAIVKSSEENSGSLRSVNAIATLEALDSSISIPSNEKEFISLQVEEIKTSLSAMVLNTAITPEELNEQQSTLEDKVEVASSNIKEASEGSIITIVTDESPVVVSIPTPPSPPAL